MKTRMGCSWCGCASAGRRAAARRSRRRTRAGVSTPSGARTSGVGECSDEGMKKAPARRDGGWSSACRGSSVRFRGGMLRAVGGDSIVPQMSSGVPRLRVHRHRPGGVCAHMGTVARIWVHVQPQTHGCIPVGVGTVRLPTICPPTLNSTHPQTWPNVLTHMSCFAETS